MFQRQWRQAQRPRRHVTTKSKTAGKKTAHRKRPDWDHTVNDLTVHQLSKEELELRRSRILSKNADRAKRELEEIVKGNTSGVGKPTGEQGKEKLHSILEESDRVLSVVKDLFGDDPKRYSGQPNVTVSPHVTTNKAALQRTLLESRLDGPTPSALNSPGGIRDESILGLAPVKPALNDLPSPSSDFTIDESTFEDSSLQMSPPVASYHPVVVDFPRFQRLVDEHRETGVGMGSGERGGGEVGERVEGDELSSIAHTGSQQGGGNVTVDSNMDLPKGGVSGPTSGHPQNLQNQYHPLEIAHKMPSLVTAAARPTTTATSGSSRTIFASQPAFVQESSHSTGSNSVSRNQRVRRLPPGRATSTGAASNGIHDDLSVLQELVQDLERELQDYEKTSGYSFPVKKPAAAQSGTFTSLTASLLASVTKLAHYLKQSEVQLKGEVAVRNQLLHAMAEQQNLMDALTADVVKLQEENSSLKSGLQQLEHTTAQHTKTLQEDILELRTKMCALEQIKPFPVKSSVATSQPTGSDGEASASAMTSPPASFAKASPEAVVDNCYSLTKSILPSQPHVNPSSPSRPAPSTNTQGPPLDASLGPTPVLPSSMKYFLPHPAMFYHPWSLANTGPGMESTPALYQTPVDGLTKPSLYLPFTPTPLSALSVPHGLSMTTLSPSSVSVSPLPLSPASQTPPTSLPAPNVSDSFLSQVPSFSVPPSGVGVPLSLASQFPSINLPPSNVNDSPVSLVSQAAIYVPRSSVSGCALPISLPSQPPPAYQPPCTLPFQSMPLQKSSLPSHRPPSNPAFSVQLPPSSSHLPLPPLSLPYSWEAPVATSPSVSRGATVHTLPSGSPAPRTNPTSLATVTLRKPATTVPAPPMTQPDLSLSLSSLPGPESTGRRSEVSPSQSSESSLDIEASLARMSSLARSVLQELAQDRGHLLSNASQPYSTPPPGQKHYLSAVESVGSMTTVTSLDSELTPPSVDSLASYQPHDLPTPPSTVKDSPLLYQHNNL